MRDHGGNAFVGFFTKGDVLVFAAVRAIEYHLPEGILTYEELASAFPGWSPEKIAAKTGIVQRRIAAPHECASDLAVAAAKG